MTTDANAAPTKTGRAPVHSHPLPEHPRLRQFPGLIAICAYMILLAAVICYEVVVGAISPICLIFSVAFFAGALGLMFLLRWGWALTLAAVALLSAFFFWSFSMHRTDADLVRGLLNLVLFLYLIRTDLRDKMR